MTLRYIVRGLLVILALVTVGYLLKDVLDQQWIDAQIRDQGARGELLFVVVCSLLGSIGLARQLIAFLGGYAFGVVWGFTLAMLAVVAALTTTLPADAQDLRESLALAHETNPTLIAQREQLRATNELVAQALSGYCFCSSAYVSIASS